MMVRNGEVQLLPIAVHLRQVKPLHLEGSNSLAKAATYKHYIAETADGGIAHVFFSKAMFSTVQMALLYDRLIALGDS